MGGSAGNLVSSICGEAGCKGQRPQRLQRLQPRPGAANRAPRAGEDQIEARPGGRAHLERGQELLGGGPVPLVIGRLRTQRSGSGGQTGAGTIRALTRRRGDRAHLELLEQLCRLLHHPVSCPQSASLRSDPLKYGRNLSPVTRAEPGLRKEGFRWTTFFLCLRKALRQLGSAQSPLRVIVASGSPGEGARAPEMLGS